MSGGVFGSPSVFVTIPKEEVSYLSRY